MRRFLVLLEPKGAAWCAADAAFTKGFSLVLETADRAAHHEDRLPAPYRDARRQCHRIIEIPGWDDHDSLLAKVKRFRFPICSRRMAARSGVRYG